MVIKDLETALARIKELEDENASMLEELEILRSRKKSGRKKHDAKWMESYQKFCTLYETGIPIREIVAQSSFSRRTAYRFKAYYDELQKKAEE